MAHKALALAFCLMMTGPAVAAQPDTRPLEINTTQPAANPAPSGGPDTRYCMRIEITGNVVEPVRCWTREQWADQGVDIDRDWARDGVRVIA